MVAAMTAPGVMRSEDECLAMAVAMEQRAGSCGSAGHRAEFLSVARGWRSLAAQAAWQDALRLD